MFEQVKEFFSPKFSIDEENIKRCLAGKCFEYKGCIPASFSTLVNLHKEAEAEVHIAKNKVERLEQLLKTFKT